MNSVITCYTGLRVSRGSSSVRKKTWQYGAPNYKQIESQANSFAANLLMPLDDFRKQIAPRMKPDLEMIGMCASRYQTSLTASILRWLQYTERRSILVVSKDGFILWARSSGPAFKTGAFFKTVGRLPIPVPSKSLAAQREVAEKNNRVLEIDTGIWLKEPCEEMVLFADQYNFTISLLHLDEATSDFESNEKNEPDAYDRIAYRTF